MEGFILKEAEKCVLGYNPISDQIISVCLQANPFNISFIQVYAPTSTANEEENGSFYYELQETINNIPRRDTSIIMVDFNAKVGNDMESNNASGKFGLGVANERGERLRPLYTWILQYGKLGIRYTTF